jgi:hypothetical protein
VDRLETADDGPSRKGITKSHEEDFGFLVILTYPLETVCEISKNIAFFQQGIVLCPIGCPTNQCIII